MMSRSNQCAICGRYKAWDDLALQLLASYSGEQDEWFECRSCSPELFEDSSARKVGG
jgi:hypothetical protein